MGINPTPTNHRSFTFDGKSTREFGVYTTGKDVFNSPERAVEMISIPGRDGEYALDKGHFNNIEVTYRAGIVSDSTTDFAEAISNFRNWLASRKGYCRLTDEYNTEEYRMAVFKNAIALEHEGLLTGEFDVTFDCKPQRYLAIGEELVEIGAWGNTEEVSGSIATFEAQSDTAIKSLVVDINPVQSGSGDPSPDNIRPISGWGSVESVVNGVNQWDEEWEVGYINPSTGQNSSQYSTMIRSTNYVPIKPNTSYYFKSSANASNGMFFYDGAKNYLSNAFPSKDKSFTTPSDACYLRFCMAVAYGTTYKNDISINYPSTDHEYHAYNGTTYTTSLGTTVYGGTLDVISGLLTVTHKYVDLGTKSWTLNSPTSTRPYNYFSTSLSDSVNWQDTSSVAPIICSNYPSVSSYNVAKDGYDKTIALGGQTLFIADSSYSSAAAFKTAMNGVQLVYKLATPTTTQLTPQQVQTLLGTNNVWANSGDVTVEYGHDPAVLTNPTLFDSRPLLEVKGYGDIQLSSSRGTKTISLDSGQIGDISLANNISSYRIEVDPNMFEAGDTVTVDMSYQDFAIVLCTDGTYYNISRTSDSISDSNSDFSTTYLKSLPGAGLQSSEIVYRVTIPTFTFNVGTTSYITDVVSGTITCKAANPSANTFTATFSVTRRYGYLSSTNTITYDALYSTVTTTAAYVTDAIISNQKIYFNSVVGHSTLSRLGNPTYIDCDIGEAYLINDGTAVSLNSYIDLGSDLPTLPSGDTEVTYDNTITKVEVQPNWWKV